MCALIAIVGRPNVGKSSLFNRLAGRRAALVDDRPGVTRDRHYSDFEIDGRRGLLVDTGGFESGGADPLAGSIAEQVAAAVSECDLALLVTDAIAGLRPEDREIARLARRSGKPVIVAVNKTDSPEKEPLAQEFHELGFTELFPVSAAHGHGTGALKARLREFLDPAPGEGAEGEADGLQEGRRRGRGRRRASGRRPPRGASGAPAGSEAQEAARYPGDPEAAGYHGEPEAAGHSAEPAAAGYTEARGTAGFSGRREKPGSFAAEERGLEVPEALSPPGERGRYAQEDEDTEGAPRPQRLAVIGRPNAGKSSLINRLCGQSRLVTDPRPGTTRDALDVEVEFRGKRYVFVDTAGVRRRGRVSDRVEKISVMRALKSLDRADAALLLIDAVEGLADQDAHIGGYAFEKGRPIIILLNKWDLVKDKKAARTAFERDLSLKMTFLEKCPWFPVSALTGRGLDRVFPLADRVMEQFTFRASTSEVNRVLEEATSRHSPPQVGKTRLKFYYAAQAGTRPPSFVLFANRPKSVHFSYLRFLTNRFREAFGLDLVPARLYVRGRRPKDDGRDR
ncbi:MAG: ribosome biogenesis GTPase Der [Deltaproteobacteria bacterium]|jgi:GTP-binding protein|nr:ribosome biogenesis GTPase Der [Deltaproteobacteria bacterium]